MTPQYIELDPVGAASRGVFSVRNGSTSTVSIDTKIEPVSPSQQGVVERVLPGSAPFVIFPPAAKIPPSGIQIFRIFWTGGPDRTESSLFRFSITNVQPREIVEKDDVRLKLAVQLGAFVAVRPMNGMSSLSTQRVWIAPDRILKLEVSNTGNKHFAASKGKIDITMLDGSGRTLLNQTFDGSYLRSRMGIGYIPPRGSRVLSIPLDALVADEIVPLIAAADAQIRVR